MSSNSSSSSTNLALSGAAYNNFVDTIKSDQTREQYKRCLVRFMRFLNITDIDNLMVLAAGGGGAGQDSKALQQKIIDYVGFLKRERKLGANAINLYLSPIMYFYAMNTHVLQVSCSRELREDAIVLRRERVLELTSYGYSQRQIATMLQVSNGTVANDQILLRQKAKDNIREYLDKVAR